MKEPLSRFFDMAKLECELRCSAEESWCMRRIEEANASEALAFAGDKNGKADVRAPCDPDHSGE